MYDIIRPVVINTMTSEPCIGNGFSECLSVVKSFTTEIDEEVDIHVSGYSQLHDNIQDMATPKVPFGSYSANADLKERLKETLKRD